MKYISGIIAFIVVAVLFYGGWQVSRYWNYNLSYKNMVEGTVCEMVKAEYLKQPCD